MATTTVLAAAAVLAFALFLLVAYYALFLRVGLADLHQRVLALEGKPLKASGLLVEESENFLRQDFGWGDFEA